MTSDLHISLPEEMRDYVALESERLFVFKEFLKSAEDIRDGRTVSAEDVKRNMAEFLDSLEKDGGL
jgi:antitoxin ParD1/3/4